MKIRIIMLAFMMMTTLAANAQWTNPPSVPAQTGSWTNPPTTGEGIPGPSVEPDVVIPGPVSESWRRHVFMTTQAHGGILASPTNTPLAGSALLWQEGRPYWGFIEAGTVDFANITGSATSNVSIASALSNKADLCGIISTTNFSLRVEGGGVLDELGRVASLVISSSVFFLSSTPISSFTYSSDASSSGAVVTPRYWFAGAWTNELIFPCYTAGVVFAQQGPTPVDTVTLSNLALNVWARPENYGKTNDFRGTKIEASDPTDPNHVATKRSVDAAVGAVNPADWSLYPAIAPVRVNNQMIFGNGWSLSQTSGVGIVSYGDLLAGTNAMRLAHNGTTVLSLQSGQSGLAVTNFSIVGGATAYLYVSTNGVVSAPMIQTSPDLMQGIWTAVTPTYTSYPTVTNNASYLYIFPVAASSFYRAMQSGLSNSVEITGTLNVSDGITVNGVVFSNGVNGADGTNGVNGATGPTGTVDLAILGGYVPTNDLRLTNSRTDSLAWHYGDSVTNVTISPVITPTLLTTPNGTGTLSSDSIYYTLGTLASNIVVTVDPGISTNTGRGWFLDFNRSTNTITFSPLTMTNKMAAVSSNTFYSTYWHAGAGQTIVTGNGQ